MSDLFLLSEAQMRRIEPFFPLSHGIPSEASRVFRRLLSVRRSYDDDKEQVFA